MFDFLYNDISYLGLFMVCFLSSTLLPLASEAFVLGFIKLDFNPNLVLIVATLGNTLGSLSTYALAYFG
ncbi:DedA family protein, partial [Campylobacter jejuni]|nr:DedA family protein [Campylobacter jejuni]